jgi:hypothetical protein
MPALPHSFTATAFIQETHTHAMLMQSNVAGLTAQAQDNAALKKRIRIEVNDGSADLQGGLVSMIGERKKDAVKLRLPGQLKQLESSDRLSKRSKLGGYDSGASLAQFAPFAAVNPLEGFRATNLSSPFERDPLPHTRLLNNTKLGITRFIKPVTETLDPLGTHELGILYKRGGNADIPLLASVVNPATFNYVMYQQQLHDFETEKEEYYMRTPGDYWRDWSVDGVPETEMMAGGGESLMTSGIGARGPQSGSGYKIETLTARGPTYMYNYWGSNLWPGATLYWCFKKHDAPAAYLLNNKMNTASLSGNWPTRKVTAYKPFQMSFLCLPHGGVVPPEARMYTDEMGNRKFDGIVGYVGQVFSVPNNHVYKNVLVDKHHTMPVIRSLPGRDGSMFHPDEGSFLDAGGVAWNDANKNVSRIDAMLPKIILNSNDGILPL